MRPCGSPEQLANRRKRAIRLLEQGYQPVEVARRLGVERRSVRRWQAAYSREGELGIEARPSPGRRDTTAVPSRESIRCSDPLFDTVPFRYASNRTLLMQDSIVYIPCVANHDCIA